MRQEEEDPKPRCSSPTEAPVRRTEHVGAFPVSTNQAMIGGVEVFGCHVRHVSVDNRLLTSRQ